MTNEQGRNAISWFEIPVTDVDRATKFYSDIFEAAFEPGPSGDSFQMVMFPESGVGGALTWGKGYVPSHQGALVYLNGGDDLNDVLGRVEGAGGKVLEAKIDIGEGFGFYAYFEDSEGNKVALHSMG